MNMKFAAAGAVLLLLVTSGCMNQKNADPGAGGKSSSLADIGTEPVTLKFMVAYGGFTDEEFDAYFVEQVKKKYPHITVQKVSGKLEEMITANDVPDILMAGLPGIPALQELKIIEDLNPYVKKFGTDLSKYDPAAIESVRRFGGNGELPAFPFRMNVPALFYNKDIFDKFGISYPKDGMTWEETASLARQLTRNDGDTQYYGISTGGADRMAMGLTLPYVDKKTNEAKLETDGWQRVLNQFKAIHSTPGYVKDGKLAGVYGMFLKEKTVGLSAYWGGRDRRHR